MGSRRFSNYWWTISIFSGGLGFLLTGISSYLKFNIFPFITSTNIQFFPQGLVMCFYGIFGLIFSFFLCIKNKRDIPITRIGQPITLQEIEKQAAELAKFLQVSLQEI